MEFSFANLLGVAAIAFSVPFLLGFFPKLRIPSVVLELVAGIILGPAVLNWITPDEVVTIMASLGVAFLLFLAGMELDLEVLKGGPLKLGAIAFIGSIAIGMLLTLPLGAAGMILSPLLVCIALAATSVGIVIPVLRDTGTIDTAAGRFTVAGGSIAEFGTIAMLAIFFSADASPAVEAILVVVISILAVAVLIGLARFANHPRASEINLKLDDSSSQVRVRLAVLLLLAAAVVAGSFGFEIILGTFMAGAVLAIVVKTASWPDEAGYRRKLEAVGFGFFVPIFFVNSGLNFELEGLFTAPELLRIGMFVAFLLIIHMIPVMLYRKHLTGREVRAAGLLQATNLSFIVVACNLGLDSGEMRPITASALITAGLISALIFPALAQKLLAKENLEPVDVTSTSDEDL